MRVKSSTDTRSNLLGDITAGTIVLAGVVWVLAWLTGVWVPPSAAQESTPAHTSAAAQPVGVLTAATPPVGALYVTTATYPDAARPTCTATVAAPGKLLTAQHCIPEDVTSITFYAGQHIDSSGTLVRPHGACTVNTPSADHVAAPDLSPATDTTWLTLNRCDGDTESLTPLPTRAVDPYTWTQTTPAHSVSIYGYPGITPSGDINPGNLYVLHTVTTTDNYSFISSFIGSRNLTATGSLAPGASGGPWILSTRSGPRIVATTSRIETADSSGVREAVSGTLPTPPPLS